MYSKKTLNVRYTLNLNLENTTIRVLLHAIEIRMIKNCLLFLKINVRTLLV